MAWLVGTARYFRMRGDTAMYIVVLMSIDSHPGPLSLADAVIEWSDPALIEAIRVEEQLVDPRTIENFDRYTLDNLGTELRTPQQGRIVSLLQSGLARLGRAWDRLFAAFKL